VLVLIFLTSKCKLMMLHVWSLLLAVCWSFVQDHDFGNQRPKSKNAFVKKQNLHINELTSLCCAYMIVHHNIENSTRHCISIRLYYELLPCKRLTEKHLITHSFGLTKKPLLLKMFSTRVEVASRQHFRADLSGNSLYTCMLWRVTLAQVYESEKRRGFVTNYT